MEDKWIEDLKLGKCLDEPSLKHLIEKLTEILIEESNISLIKSPVIICGDIHGQFYDLLKLLSLGGSLPKTNYLFLGDYVDRGNNSVEVIELLFCYKLKYPNNIFLLRGNHESRQISFTYGFYEEITRKYGNSNPWRYIMDLFDYLPLSAIIEQKIFCVHGGLSPFISTVDQIRLINRKLEIPHDGAFCDLLWSDPDDIETWNISSRGAGWIFGYKVVNEFNYLNGIELICRAHQLVNEGYKFWFKDKNLVTIWSCPNYCYRCGNKASFMKISGNGNLREFFVFDTVKESISSSQVKTLVPYFL
jgi:serine/threonine-protein phosphatase 6 catalytic subunit